MGSRIVVATGDIAQTEISRMVLPALTAQGFEVRSFLGDGKGFTVPDEMKESIAHAKFVFTGLSSTVDRSARELAALEIARRHGIPYGVILDTYGAHRRIWGEQYLRNASLIFVVSESQRAEVSGIFPGPRVVVSGNPLWWRWFEGERLSRKEVRERLEIPDDGFFILCPLTKTFTVNIALGYALLEAMESLGPYKPDVIVAPHPSDDHRVYELMADAARERLAMPIRVVNGSRSVLLEGADVVFAAASVSVSMEAACRRLPVFVFGGSTIVGRWNRSEGRYEDPAHEEPCKRGAMMPVYSGEHFALMIAKIRSDAVFREQLLRHQEEVFPFQSSDQSITTMVEAIREASRTH